MSSVINMTDSILTQTLASTDNPDERTGFDKASQAVLFSTRRLLQGLACLSLLAISLLQAVAAESVVAPLQTADQLYALDNLLKVEIFIKEDAWDRLRFSWRGEEQQEVEGKAVPVKTDYQDEPGDVVINGVRVAKVGIRKKGFFGSLSSQRPSLKVKFDEYVKGQRFLGLEGITLNNNQQDTTQIRQYLSYEWFRRAGLPAPRCNLARVYVNGRYFGIYSNVEPLSQSFLQEHFGSSKGTLYESATHDFRIRAIEEFQIKNNKKANDRSSLRKVAGLLENLESVDMEELSKVVNLDQFLKFWVTEMLLGHWDGYFGNVNNFFVYTNPKNGLCEFIPWGTDQTFGGPNPFIAEKAPMIIRGKGRLCAALYANPAYRKRYLKLVAQQLEHWWNPPALLAEVERAASLIRPHLLVRAGEFDEALALLRKSIEGVSSQVATELKDPPVKWLIPPQDDSLTQQAKGPAWAGSVTGTFLIPYGKFNLTNQAVLKDTTLSMVWRGKPLAYSVRTGTAGFKRPDPLWYDSPEVLMAFTTLETGQTVWLYMKMDPDLLARGAKLKLHKSQVTCWFGTSLAGKPEFSIFGTAEGVTQAELVELGGAKYVKGTIDAQLNSRREELKFQK